MAKKKVETSSALRVQWLEHEFGPRKPRIRVRLSSWANDAFEIVTWDEFQAFKALAEKLFAMAIVFEELH